MAEKMTLEEFIQKCEWEGGLIAGFDYGLTGDCLNDDYPEIKKSINLAYDAYRSLDLLCDEVKDLILDKTGKNWENHCCEI